MKNITIILSLLLSTQLFSSELSWVDEQIEAIKPSRVGMQNSKVSSLKNPFIFLSKNKKKTATKASSTKTSQTSSKKSTKSKKTFQLTLVMNSAAMINGEWYKVGDTLNGYKVKKVSNTSVLLSKKKKKLLLSTKTDSKKLNFKNK